MAVDSSKRRLRTLAKKLERIFITSMIGLLVPASAQAVEVAVGIDNLEFPAPSGFVEISGVSTSARERAESLTPSINRLLAVYLSEEDADRLRRGQPAKWDRYMMIQPKGHRSGNIRLCC